MSGKLLGVISAGVLASTLVSGAWAQPDSGSAHGGGHDDMPGHMSGSGMKGGHGGGGMHGSGMQAPHGKPSGHGRMGGHGMMHGRGMMGGAMGKLTTPYVAGVLGLSEEQTQRIEDIQRSNAREHWSLTQQMRERHRALMGLMRESAPDPQALAEAHDQASAAHRQLLVLQAEIRREVLGVLDDD